MKSLLVVIDMQNDFIDGALGTEEAKKVLLPIAKKIVSWKGDIICTMDTHSENYLDTREGKSLPVVHCIENTDGWKINSKINFALKKSGNNVRFLKKQTFGSPKLANHIKQNEYDYVEFIGVCTDICVISNALITKAAIPEIEIVVDASCVAGSTIENNASALTILKQCQIKLINE